jgi:hypothetical protein
MKRKRNFLSAMPPIHRALFLVLFILNLILLASSPIIILRHRDNLIYLSEAEKKINEADDALIVFNRLLNNINNIAFDTIYYGYAATEQGKGHSFTAFSLYYNGQYYIITAGHNVENNGLKYKDFVFKRSDKNIEIRPKLLFYENDYKNNKDYAVFYDEKVMKGLKPAENDRTPAFVAGSIEKKANIIKKYDVSAVATEGESGSPVLNKECRVIGILIKSRMEYTDLAIVLQALEESMY